MKVSRAPFPIATALLAFVIAAVYGRELAGDGMGMCRDLGFIPAHPTFATALSSLFLHDPDDFWHLAGNIVALIVFGTLVEQGLGHVRLLMLYVLGGVGANAFHLLANSGSLQPEVGASGAVFAIMAAAAMLYSRLVGFVGTLAAMNIWQTIAGTGGEVATAAHVGGFLTGFVLTLVVFGRRLADIRGWRLTRCRARRGIAIDPV